MKSASRAADSATNLREAADFETPDPGGAGTSPSGSRTARPNRRVDTLISIRFIAQRPSQSSSAAVSQLGPRGRPRLDPRALDLDLAGLEADPSPRSDPTVRPPRRVATVARPAGSRDIRLHHRAECLDPCRKAEPIEARPHLCKRFVHSPSRRQTSRCEISRHGVALLCGISTRAYRLKVGNADLFRKFNRTRDIPG